MSRLKLSVMELVKLTSVSDAAQALETARELAINVESWGYNRIWVAEHHNMEAIASAATPVVVSHLAAATKTIRVGAGGVMLPNHVPYVVAEQFGTLENLYPGRIDLGLGRAPGTDGATLRALRRDVRASEHFADDVLELQSYFAPRRAGQRVVAYPAAGTNVPLWILGSSLYGANLAAAMGLPFAFASQFAPQQLHAAIKVYRENFKPSPQLAQPYIMAGVNVFAASSTEEAEYLSSTAKIFASDFLRGGPRVLQPPMDAIDEYLTVAEKAQVSEMMKYSFVGDVFKIRQELHEFVERTGVDEVIIVSDIFDPLARLSSYQIAAQAAGLVAQ